MRNIYLSPHLDDVAFSLGTRALDEPGGVLVNACSVSGYVAGAPLDQRPSPDVVERTSATRNDEDAHFAKLASLERIALGLAEPNVHGLSPFGSRDLAARMAAIGEPLRAALDRLQLEGGPARLFVPAGIGRHVDHLAVRDIAIDWYRAKPDRATLAFYEDLPYAADWRKRVQGILDLLRVTRGFRLTRKSWPASPQKLRAINLYASQHAQPVTVPATFSPAALWPRGAHEAIWEVVAR